MNMIQFRTWPVEHKAVSSVLQYARPRFHRMFHPSPPDEHDDTFRSDPARWLPMNTMMTLFLHSDPAMYTSPSRTYICASRRSRPRPYVRTWPYLLSCTLAAVRTCTCYVRVFTTTRARLYIDQYVRTHSRPERQRYVRFDQVGPDCQALPCVRRCSWWVPAVRGANRFFAWTHFLAAAVRWRNNYFACNKEALPYCGRQVKR